MRDLISRQQAIDATKKHYRAHDNDLLELIAFDIEQLPSVQPERASCKQVTGKLDLISRQDAIDAIVKCTNCNTPKDLKEYVAEHSLWSLWSGGVLEALEAVEALPSATLYTEEETQTMQDLEPAQMDKMYELGKEERKKGEWLKINDIDGFVQCSSCGAVLDYSIIETLHFPFCPNCGSYNGGEKIEAD